MTRFVKGRKISKALSYSRSYNIYFNMGKVMIKKVTRRISRFIINHFFCGLHFFCVKRGLLRFGGIKVGKGVRIVGPINFGTIVQIEIGEGTFINHDFNIEGNGQLIIGKNCDFAPNVRVLTGTHVIGDNSRRAGEGKSLKVCVGDGCWICANTVILGTVSIGNGSVVGCSSMVNRDIPQNVLACGVPSKVIKQLD